MISRRTFLLSAALAPLLGRAGLAKADATDDPWPDIRDALFGDRVIAENDGIITVEAPKRAYDAAIVPVIVHAAIPQTAERYIKTVHLVIDKNPAPEAAVFHFTLDSGDATFSTRVRINEYTNVRAIAELNDGSLHMALQFVKAAGGCSAPSLKDKEKAFANLGRMKLKQPDQIALNQPNQAQLLVSHPNFSGMQFDQISRNYIPALFIQNVTVRMNGKTVVEGQISQAVSRNPVFSFRVKGGAKGDKIEVSWVDNKGESNKTEAVVA